jgi:hypothetical protein
MFLQSSEGTHAPQPGPRRVRAAADAIYSGYGEKAGGGIRGGKQDRLFTEGNAFLVREFPMLDYIRRATVIP